MDALTKIVEDVLMHLSNQNALDIGDNIIFEEF